MKFVRTLSLLILLGVTFGTVIGCAEEGVGTPEAVEPSSPEDSQDQDETDE